MNKAPKTYTSDKVQIHSGDSVRLKSGGPVMTVGRGIRVNGDHFMVETVWFHDGIVHRGAFAPFELVSA